jgi:hypothetical protein
MTRSSTARTPGRGDVTQVAPIQDDHCRGDSVLSSGQHLNSLQAIVPKKKKRRVRHFRAITKSVAGIIHRVAEYFALEKQKGHAMNLQKVVDRTAAACQVSRKTVIKVRKCDDIENWGVEDDHSDTMELTMNSRFSTPVSINTLRFRLNKTKKIDLLQSCNSPRFL